MSRYRRLKIEGGAFFFTLTLADRSSNLLLRQIERLRRAYAETERRRPFETVAICILPDHIHALWRLPNGDADYAARWSLFKSSFSRGIPAAKKRSISKIAKPKKASGNAAIGSTPFVMMPISSGMLITSITIRRNMGW
jgi:putative transposase